MSADLTFGQMTVIGLSIAGAVWLASPSAPAPTHATIKDFRGPAVFGCASKDKAQELESLADGYDRGAAVRFAFRHCERFRTRERVEIECCDRDRWVSIRRPGDDRTYWTASGNIDPERAP